MRRYAAFFGLLCVLLIGATIFAQEDSARPRTYYDSLNLESPEDAFHLFIEAFHRQDYPTVFMVFSPNAQMVFQQKVNLLRYSELIAGHAVQYITGENFPSLREWEHVDTWYMFDFFMLAADEHDGFLIDLRGDVEILRVKAVIVDDDPVIDIYAAVEGIDEEVRFRMMQSPQGRWRVHQVALPGAGDIALWGLPAD